MFNQSWAILLVTVVMEGLLEDHSGNKRKYLRKLDLAGCVFAFNHQNNLVIPF